VGSIWAPAFAGETEIEGLLPPKAAGRNVCPHRPRSVCDGLSPNIAR
jgi:hypothetical protein